MISETWRSGSYDPEKIENRYVRYSGMGVFVWIETQLFGKKRRDVRTGSCIVGDLPQEISYEAVFLHEHGVYPPYVKWPLT